MMTGTSGSLASYTITSRLWRGIMRAESAWTLARTLEASPRSWAQKRELLEVRSTPCRNCAGIGVFLLGQPWNINDGRKFSQTYRVT